MQILALSSSRVGDSEYLQPFLHLFHELMGNKSSRVAFIPFASVKSYQEYYEKVAHALSDFPCQIQMATPDNASHLINSCDTLIVGGGNTFKLLHDLHSLALIEPIRLRIREGMRYIGWSAGANILGPSICTTNDMPIINPRTFEALQLLPFQINPHFYNLVIPGFNGETREQRLEEFLTLNPESEVMALPEGTAIFQNRDEILFRGREGYRFQNRKGQIIKDVFAEGALIGKVK